MVLESCDFVHTENLPYAEVVLATRSCSGVAFQEVVAASDRSCDGAYALLLDQEDEASRLEALLEDPYLYRKKFCSRYRYVGTPREGSGAEAQGGMLLIPRYIRCSASTHRLAIVNVLEREDGEGVLRSWLQLSYEDVPSQRRGSALFKPPQAEVLRRREESYGCGRLPVGELSVDSDGDTNVVRLAVATALTEWLGQGACVQVGRGGYSTSHEGMVHAFLLLTPESSRLVKDFMDGKSLGVGETLGPGESKQFVQTTGRDAPYFWHYDVYLGFFRHSCFAPRCGRDPDRPKMGGFTYRAVVSNHRQRSMCTSSDRLGSEMTLLPVRNGFLTLGRLDHRYNTEYFGKHTKNTILSYSSETMSRELRIMDSPHYRALRHRAAFEELVLDVDAANAEIRREAEEGRVSRAAEEARGRDEEPRRMRDAVLDRFKDEAAEKMADAEKRVEEGTMREQEYIKLCNDLRDEYTVRAELARH